MLDENNQINLSTHMGDNKSGLLVAGGMSNQVAQGSKKSRDNRKKARGVNGNFNQDQDTGHDKSNPDHSRKNYANLVSQGLASAHEQLDKEQRPKEYGLCSFASITKLTQLMDLMRMSEVKHNSRKIAMQQHNPVDIKPKSTNLIEPGQAFAESSKDDVRMHAVNYPFELNASDRDTNDSD